MTLLQISEIIWRLYQNGKAYANNQHVLKADLEQKCKLLIADLIRQRYYESKKLDEFGRPDFSFVSPMLQVKRYPLGAREGKGKRRFDMDIDIYRLPRNAQFTNIYLIGDCGDQLGEITQVEVSEASFYINDPELSDYMFYVPKGKGGDTYNVPDCIHSLDIETTYEMGPQTEIDMSMASVVADQVLGVVLGIKKQYYSEEAQRQINEQNVVQ